ncbi:hypothetical protein SH661x_004494 [Planctomicrobium sp. SH661]|uniref:hypothetical protein n=1 Tax=Planctomicrobium sp. SH661 TaxID=3448124 RepID=UPI003F5B669D
MVKILAMLGFGVAMFALAAGGSWYVQNNVLGKSGHGASSGSSHGAHASSGSHGSHAAASSLHASDSHSESSPAAEAHGHAAASTDGHGDSHGAPALSLTNPPPVRGVLTKGPVDGQMPVPIRPREMSVEELLRYGMGVKERENQVKLQEEALQKRRVQHQLAQADIEGERKEIDGLRVQVAEQLKQAEMLIEKLKQTRSQFLQDQANAAEEMQQIKHERVEIDEEHMDNTKRLSQWIQSMEPEKAAEVLKSMANDGEQQLEIAVQILRNLEEREAAKILSAIDDPKLVQLLIEKFRNLKRPPAKTAARR